MYNNEDPNSGASQGQNPQQHDQMDLLSAVVNEAIGADDEHQLLVEDFAGLDQLVNSMDEMAAAGIGDELLVQGGDEHYSLSQPMVGSTVEVETTEHYGDVHHQLEQQQIQQQLPNLSLGSDVLMVNQPSQQKIVVTSNNMNILEHPSLMNIFGSNQIQQQQQTMMPPPQPMPIKLSQPSASNLINPNSVTITPPQSVYRPIQPLPPTIAQKSVPPSLSTTITSPTLSKSGQIQPQQTQVFFTAAQPHHQILRGPPTIVSVGQMVQTSQQQQSTNTSVPILFVQQQHGQQNSGTLLTSTAVSSVSPAFAITSQSPSTSGISGNTLGGPIIQIANRQKLIPVSTATEVVQQRVVQLPANVRLAPLGQTVQLGRGQQLITAGSSQQQQQIKLAPATLTTSSSSTATPMNAPQQQPRTIFLKTVKQPNMQYISFISAPSTLTTGVAPGTSSTSIGGQQNITVQGTTTVHHPIQNQTQAKMIQTPKQFISKQPQQQTIMTTSKPSAATLKPNMVHLVPASFANTISTGGTQRVFQLGSGTNSIKIHQPRASAPGASRGISTPSSGPSSVGGKPTSIWMLPKQQLIKVEGGNAGSSLSTIQLQATPKPLIHTQTGYHGSSFSLSGSSGGGSKYVPIAPYPQGQYYQQGQQGQGQPMIFKTEDILHQGGNKITVVKIPTLSSENAPTGSSATPFPEETRRKPCNCTRSQCLKLYCDCFANGEFCNNCNCVSCCNNLSNEETRQKAIRLCLDRNPNAFHPKIGQATRGGGGGGGSSAGSGTTGGNAVEVERKHTKGCCCKRSGCLKNYCECYEAKILCSDRCKCHGCKNFEESTERKSLMYLADAAEVRSVQQSTTNKVHIWGPDLKLKLPVKVKADSHPFNIFTDEILEATASCLMAQAEEGEFENYSEDNVQRLILDQFGECLSQILNMAASNGVEDDLSDDEKSTASGSVASDVKPGISGINSID